MIGHGLKTVEEVVDRVVGFWGSAIIQTALELHIADHLTAGPTTPQVIAAAEGCDPRATTVLMDALCGLGFLDKRDGQYRLEPIVERILPSMSYLTPFSLDRDAFATWSRLTDAIKTGFPVGATVDYWQNFALTTREMTRARGSLLTQIVKTGDGRNRILDIGCGAGGLGYGLALADPAVTVTGIDREPILAIARENARSLGIADRVSFRDIDIIAADDLGYGEYDLAILSNMLHLFDEASNRDLIRKTSVALADGGRIIVQDVLPDNDRRLTSYPLMFAVELLLRTSTGTTYTMAEICSWLGEAGFQAIEPLPTIAYLTTITAHKSGTNPRRVDHSSP